jgi:hypothetical protein
MRRRLLEAAVAVLAFGVWGTLAYKGGLRLLARLEGLPISGAWWIDAASLIIGSRGASRASRRSTPSACGSPGRPELARGRSGRLAEDLPRRVPGAPAPSR